MKKIAYACDHRGVEWKPVIFECARALGYEVVDCGTYSGDSCDYPDFMIRAAEKVAGGECRFAIGVCHSGIGSSIIANKVKGVRAALVNGAEQAKLSRAHNDANMLILGSGFLDPKELIPVIKTWLETPFEGGRHERRVEKIRTYENEHTHGC